MSRRRSWCTAVQPPCVYFSSSQRVRTSVPPPLSSPLSVWLSPPSYLVTEPRTAAAVLSDQLAAGPHLGNPGCLPHPSQEEPQGPRPLTPDRTDTPPPREPALTGRAPRVSCGAGRGQVCEDGAGAGLVAAAGKRARACGCFNRVGGGHNGGSGWEQKRDALTRAKHATSPTLRAVPL